MKSLLFQLSALVTVTEFFLQIPIQDLAAPVVFVITSRRGPRRKHGCLILVEVFTAPFRSNGRDADHRKRRSPIVAGVT
jgi:hypothetical protein